VPPAGEVGCEPKPNEVFVDGAGAPKAKGEGWVKVEGLLGAELEVACPNGFVFCGVPKENGENGQNGKEEDEEEDDKKSSSSHEKQKKSSSSSSSEEKEKDTKINSYQSKITTPAPTKRSSGIFSSILGKRNRSESDNYTSLKKRRLSISSNEFMKNADPIKLRIDGVYYDIEPKFFKGTGAFGWYNNGRQEFQVNEENLNVAWNLNMTVIGTK